MKTWDLSTRLTKYNMAYLSASSCVSLIENYSEITELKFGGLDLNAKGTKQLRPVVLFSVVFTVINSEV